MANELPLGARRYGSLNDFNEQTTETEVTLENREGGISVTVSWRNADNPYASWFLRDTFLKDQLERWDHIPVPKKLVFSDSAGHILLIGCRAHGYEASMRGAGSGRLWARAAILGVDHDIDYMNPHAMSSEISNLGQWIGAGSWTVVRTHDGPIESVIFTSVRIPPIELGCFDGITLTLNFESKDSRDPKTHHRILEDKVYCATRSEDERPWQEHLNLSHAIRDLLSLSRWSVEASQVVSVSRNDDFIRTMDGKIHGKYTRHVVVPISESPIPELTNNPHLVKFEELGPQGLKAWIELRTCFSRALDPVITSIYLQNATPNTLLAHTGPGVEALGYLLMRRDGVSKIDARNSRLACRLERILADLGDILPFDPVVWPEETAKIYNGLKHVNREEPDPVDVMNAWRECVLVTRAWVAHELGVPADLLQERLAEDPQRFPYSKSE